MAIHGKVDLLLCTLLNCSEDLVRKLRYKDPRVSKKNVSVSHKIDSNRIFAKNVGLPSCVSNFRKVHKTRRIVMDWACIGEEQEKQRDQDADKRPQIEDRKISRAPPGHLLGGTLAGRPTRLILHNCLFV